MTTMPNETHRISSIVVCAMLALVPMPVFAQTKATVLRDMRRLESLISDIRIIEGRIPGLRHRIDGQRQRQEDIAGAVVRLQGRHPWLKRMDPGAGMDADLLPRDMRSWLGMGSPSDSAKEIWDEFTGYVERSEAIGRDIASRLAEIEQLREDIETTGGARDVRQMERDLEGLRGRLEEMEREDEARANLRLVEDTLERWRREGNYPRMLLDDLATIGRNHGLTRARLTVMKQRIIQKLDGSLLADHLAKRDRAMAASMCERAHACFSSDGVNDEGRRGVVSDVLEGAQENMRNAVER